MSKLSLFTLSLVFGLCLCQGLGLQARAAEPEPLEEATGLADEPVAIERASHASQWKLRSYVSILAVEERRGTDLVRASAPELEWGNTAQRAMGGGTDVFADFNLYSRDREGRAYLNQIGVRGAMGESGAYAIGKERNRRSPGLVVSPSDFLFSQTALPGQREDRAGIWLARASWQGENASADAFYLAGDSLDDSGWMKRDQREGAALRALFKVQGGDFNILAGRRAGVDHAGVSVEGFLRKVWKTYVEAGAKSDSLNPVVARRNLAAFLAGVDYQGSEDFSCRVEYFEQQDGLSADEFQSLRRLAALGFMPSATRGTAFLRQKYVIAGLQFPEIRDRYNLFFSAIASAEDDGRVIVARSEWLSGPHSLLGLTWQEVAGGVDSQYAFRGFDRQLFVEFKYTF